MFDDLVKIRFSNEKCHEDIEFYVTQCRNKKSDILHFLFASCLRNYL